MSVIRVIAPSVVSVRRSTALTAAVAELHRTGQSPDTLRFYVSPPAVLVGRYGPLASEVNVRHCRRSGIEIARDVVDRPPIYSDVHTLSWDLVMDRQHLGGTLAGALDHVCKALAAGLARLGLPARTGSVGTIVIADACLGIAGASIDGPTLICRGALHLACDIRAVVAALARPPGRITSLATFLGRTPDMDEVIGVITPALADARRTGTIVDQLTESETALTDRLYAEQFGTDAFVVGEGVERSPLRPMRRQSS